MIFVQANRCLPLMHMHTRSEVSHLFMCIRLNVNIGNWSSMPDHWYNDACRTNTLWRVNTLLVLWWMTCTDITACCTYTRVNHSGGRTRAFVYVSGCHGLPRGTSISSFSSLLEATYQTLSIVVRRFFHMLSFFATGYPHNDFLCPRRQFSCIDFTSYILLSAM